MVRTKCSPTWTVVVGCFIIHVIMDGLLYSFGVFYMEFIDYFRSDKGDVSFIGSLLNGMNSLAGLLASVLINRFGSRTVAISGAVLSTTGYILSSVVSKLYWLYITFGIMPGVGAAFMYVSAIVSVSHCFEKRRSLAMGIGISGTGIGTFLFAPLTKYLINEYSWRGASLIEAGIMLNCVIGGALLQSDSFPEQKEATITTNNARVKGKRLLPDNPISKSDGSLYNNGSKLLNHKFMSCHNLHNSQSDNNYTACLIQTSKYQQMQGKHISTCRTRTRTLFLKMFGISLLTNTAFFFYVLSSCLSEFGFKMPYIYLPDHAKEFGIHETKAAFLLSAAGIANTISRVMFGCIASLSFANPCFIYGGMIIIGGLATVLSPLNDEFEFLLCYALLLGTCMGAYLCLIAIVLVEFVGVDKLTSAFGLILLFQGIVILFGVPAVGFLYDAFQRYDISFYSAGAILICSGIIFFIGYAINRCRHNDVISNNDVDINVANL